MEKEQLELLETVEETVRPEEEGEVLEEEGEVLVEELPAFDLALLQGCGDVWDS